MAERLASGELAVSVGEIYGLAEAAEALDLAVAGGGGDAVVLRVSPTPTVVAVDDQARGPSAGGPLSGGGDGSIEQGEQLDEVALGGGLVVGGRVGHGVAVRGALVKL